ncbi:efflux RND transporter permease subunit [Limisphaera sp. VF-2]|uniref:efflux RND transporter permease subunit n=1 Tax=Limisphaera sp. VF-2 TaxID=3400418 RepID=UPI00309627C7
MLERIIVFSLQNRLLICVLAGLCTLLGIQALQQLPVDAFPDTTPVQVQVNVQAPALNAEEIEQQITLPLERALGGLPGLVQLRSLSRFGLAQVVATFDEDTPMPLARQWVAERLATVELPEGVERPRLGPISSGLGEVFHYVVRTDNPARNLAELREWHDWVIRPALLQVPGVAEVNTWGGLEKQYHVVPDPQLLLKYSVTVEDLIQTLQANNRNVGGGVITQAGESLLVHGLGRLTHVTQIANLVVTTREGVPVRVGDVAEVHIGHGLRIGAVTAEGRGEAVLGLGFMLLGENSARVTRALRAKLAEVQSTLPADIQVEVFYDRTELVDQVIRTVRHNLLAGALLVVSVLFAFLGHLRAGLIVALAIPLSMLFAGQMMLQAGIAASLLSLGAIDFGLIVDSSVIMVENCARHAALRPNRPLLEVVREAALEVRRPTMFGELIILIVFLPVLTLEGVEGKLFRPMALTMIFALFGAMVLSLTLMPVLASWLLPRAARQEEPWLTRWLGRAYAPILEAALRYRTATLLGALAIVGAGALLAAQRGAEFLPRLGEGALAINIVRLTGVSVEEAAAGNTWIERELLREFPDEIARVWSRLGSAEVATDPMGIEVTDVFVALKPRHAWKRARTQAELAEAMRQVLARVPGIRVAFSQPIEMRVNEMIAGLRGDVAVKVFGEDLATLRSLAERIGQVLADVPGARDVALEPWTGQPVLQVVARSDSADRLGVAADEILTAVELVGGLAVGDVQEGLRRFPLVVRWPDSIRRDPDTLSGLLLPLSSGAWLPLGQLALFNQTEGLAVIQREWGQRRVAVQANVQGRDVAGFVAEAQRRVAEQVRLPAGYRLEWGGQFEHYQRAVRRLQFIVPVALGLVFFLLYLSLRSWRDVAMVATGIPLGAVGGVVALWLRDMPFTVSAAIGFIALSGVAILNGLVLVTFMRQRLAIGIPWETAVREACRVRLRPVLMTALVAAAGFLPMALNTGVGAEVQRPLATVVIGGVLTNTLLTLVVLPALYVTWRSPEAAR